jgi:hypothetical protein
MSLRVERKNLAFFSEIVTLARRSASARGSGKALMERKDRPAKIRNRVIARGNFATPAGTKKSPERDGRSTGRNGQEAQQAAPPGLLRFYDHLYRSFESL